MWGDFDAAAVWKGCCLQGSRRMLRHRCRRFGVGTCKYGAGATLQKLFNFA